MIWYFYKSGKSVLKSFHPSFNHKYFTIICYLFKHFKNRFDHHKNFHEFYFVSKNLKVFSLKKMLCCLSHPIATIQCNSRKKLHAAMLIMLKCSIVLKFFKLCPRGVYLWNNLFNYQCTLLCTIKSENFHQLVDTNLQIISEI